MICSRQWWFSRCLPLVVENKLAGQRNRFAGQPEFGMDKSRSTRAELPAILGPFTISHTTHSMVKLTDLPPELLAAVLKGLDWDDLLRIEK